MILYIYKIESIIIKTNLLRNINEKVNYERGNDSMDRQWICIKGRKLLCTEFIYILDNYRYCSALRVRGDVVCERYNSMIYVLQELTNDYMNGTDNIGDQLLDFFERHYMELPSERKLPEALEELFIQLETKLNVDLTEMLDRCVIHTNEAYLRIQELQLKEEKRVSMVKALIEKNKIDISKDDKTENRIRNLLLLQKAKQKSELYKMDEKEINVTRVWCDLFISSVFSETISYGLM